MQNPYLSKKFQPFSKKKYPKKSLAFIPPIDKYSIHLHKRKEIVNCPRGLKFQSKRDLSK
jgi:hypothetical protein